MIVCGRCGNAEHDPGAAFCGACGEFLEYVGVPRDDAAGAAGPVPAQRPPDGDGATTADGPPEVATLSAASGVAAVVAVAAVPEQPADAPTGAGAVLPGEEAQLRAARRAAEPVGPHDVACPSCAAGNAAARTFCRRCGATLAAPPPPQRRPWWRRLLDAVLRRWRSWRRRDAGERPRRWDRQRPAGAAGRRRMRLLRDVPIPMHVITPVLLVLSVAGVGVPSVRDRAVAAAGDAVAQVRRVVAPQYAPVRPVGVTASSALPDHPAEAAADGVTTTHWAEAADGDGAGQALVLEYDRPVDLRRVGVRTGASGSPEAFAREPRPERLLLVAGDRQQEVVLRDTVELQVHDVDLDDVQRLEVRVLSVFGGQQGSAASVTEVTGFSVR